MAKSFPYLIAFSLPCCIIISSLGFLLVVCVGPVRVVPLWRAGPNSIGAVMGKRRIMDASLDVEYRAAGSKGHSSVVAAQEAALAKEAELMTLNENLSAVVVPFLPSVHRMINDAYSVIDVELRRLGHEAANRGGLDKVQTGQFERYTAALVKLVNVGRLIADGSEVDAMSDEELTRRVTEKLLKGAPRGRK